ncbi:hypothetical protein K0C01_09455 [Salinarchaeum sp. IM2453]|uniref:hypothetical protein n=1 Tax=Salinarchaeum sp. IM2453 TaxID=2862870 RepID=UPI001C83D3E8|nr:hypothetical protein [Salinarchaeum sp. IM2453]QZA88018.1 hypothetical protein K0C01_09455 [Salinarchaeum sp. IM2453]
MSRCSTTTEYQRCSQLAELCERQGQDYVVIKNNPQALPDLRADCDAYVFSDVMETETATVSNLEES